MSRWSLSNPMIPFQDTPNPPGNVTTLPEQETRVSQGSGGRYCEGCPRCQDDGAGFCTMRHPQYNNLHPVCRRCGHCVLRGKHSDDISDLEGE